MTRRDDLQAVVDRDRAHLESLRASVRANAGMLDLNALAMDKERRAGHSVSPELLAQAVRLRERADETECEYEHLMRHLARTYAERPDLASVLREGHGP